MSKSSSMKTLKMRFQGQVQILASAPNLADTAWTFHKLVNTVANRLPTASIANGLELSFVDADGDRITLATDDDLAMAWPLIFESRAKIDVAVRGQAQEDATTPSVASATPTDARSSAGVEDDFVEISKTISQLADDIIPFHIDPKTEGYRVDGPSTSGSNPTPAVASSAKSASGSSSTSGTSAPHRSPSVLAGKAPAPRSEASAPAASTVPPTNASPSVSGNNEDPPEEVPHFHHRHHGRCGGRRHHGPRGGSFAEAGNHQPRQPNPALDHIARTVTALFSSFINDFQDAAARTREQTRARAEAERTARSTAPSATASDADGPQASATGGNDVPPPAPQFQEFADVLAGWGASFVEALDRNYSRRGQNGATADNAAPNLAETVQDRMQQAFETYGQARQQWDQTMRGAGDAYGEAMRQFQNMAGGRRERDPWA